MKIITMASRTEADAMIIKFFEKADLPEQACGAIMQDFRHELDMQPVEKNESDPDAT